MNVLLTFVMLHAPSLECCSALWDCPLSEKLTWCRFRTQISNANWDNLLGFGKEVIRLCELGLMKPDGLRADVIDVVYLHVFASVSPQLAIIIWRWRTIYLSMAQMSTRRTKVALFLSTMRPLTGWVQQEPNGRVFFVWRGWHTDIC